MTSVPPPQGQPPSWGQQPQQQVLPFSGPHASTTRPPAGHGALVLTLQGSALTGGFTPTVRIDGYQVPAAYGANFYPLRPGRHRVDVHAQWMRQYGQAGMDLDIHEGHIVPGFYALPWHQFTTGSIGHVQQSRRGLGVLLAIVGVTVLLICCSGLLVTLVGQ